MENSPYILASAALLALLAFAALTAPERPVERQRSILTEAAREWRDSLKVEYSRQRFERYEAEFGPVVAGMVRRTLDEADSLIEAGEKIHTAFPQSNSTTR